MKRIVVTGAGGLLGWHAHSRLHAANCTARFRGEPSPYDIVALGHAEFDNDVVLSSAVKGADAILHFAGVNRGSEEAVASENPAIARRLISACRDCGEDPHVVYANSIHAVTDTVYGRSKRAAGEELAAFASRYTDLILPHIFGECAQPFYNNVTATFIHQIISGKNISVNPDGYIKLLHSGEAAQEAINAVLARTTGPLQPTPFTISVPDLLVKLKSFHESYQANIYPDVSDTIDLNLFNSYRAATYPDHWPKHLQLNTDKRGILFEAVKGGGGGQTFLSTTKPGVTRGDHFHLRKIERFVVIQGEAVIRLRKVLSDQVWEYRVSGDEPAFIDMPTLHTHSLENVGSEDLLTLFWTNELFNPADSDTYADKVLK